jgi:hypothetical protein
LDVTLLGWPDAMKTPIRARNGSQQKEKIMTNLQKLQRAAIASALASGLMSVGIAASAQTAGTPATPATTGATSVSMSTVSSSSSRLAQLEAENADERRIAFRREGTSQ